MNLVTWLQEEEAHVQGTVLEPCKVSAKVEIGPSASDLQVQLSHMRLNVSPDVLELASSLKASVLEPLIQPPPGRSCPATVTRKDLLVLTRT